MRILFVLLMLTMAGAAAAQEPGDYPFNGFFAGIESSVAPIDMAARCALSFLDQRPDGTFATYVVDLKTFDGGKGPLAYKQYYSGECTYDAKTRIETCRTSMAQRPNNQPAVSYDVMSSHNENRVAITLVDSMAEAEEVAKVGIGGKGKLYYHRCPVDDDVIAAALTPDATDLTDNDAYNLTFPKPELLASPDVAALVEAVGKR